MKRNLLLLFSLVWVLMLGAQNLYVGTYNIRNNNDNGDEERGDGWSVRQKVVCDQLNFESPDIFGTQEVLVGQLHDMQRRMPEYATLGVGRDDGKEGGEYSAIFYKKDRLKLLDDGHFWLNETPDRPKLGWDAACVRICTWGLFEERESGKQFYFFTLHMDHVGVVARRESAKLIVERIRETAKGRPVIVTGDFNVDQHNDIFSIFTQSGLLADSYELAQQRFIENGTFNSFDPSMKTDSRIDHIFVSPNITVSHYGVLTNMYWRPIANQEDVKGNAAPSEISLRKYAIHTPSDHYPVFAKLKLGK
jgi:endonuclease/exonuclease/phosphatase family metal-dependent hydrolase